MVNIFRIFCFCLFDCFFLFWSVCKLPFELLYVQVEEAEIKICEVSGEKVDNKVRLDVLKNEERMIAEENLELITEEEEKKKKVFTVM